MPHSKGILTDIYSLDVYGMPLALLANIRLVIGFTRKKHSSLVVLSVSDK